jgi:hypothetical protein
MVSNRWHDVDKKERGGDIMCEEVLSRVEQVEKKRDFWKEQIEHWQQSDLSQTEYCRRHDLKRHQLAYWKKRFLKAGSDVSFVPVRLDDVPDIPAQPVTAPLSLIINPHFKIEIRTGFDTRLLRQVILALQGIA